ncbi:AraC family transcriptional regulator ligand-binding domain-containing protein [Variovorax sp. LARHSF232]
MLPPSPPPPARRAPRRVPVRYFALMVDWLRAQGVDGARLLALAGIEPGRMALADDGMLALHEAQALIDGAYRLSGRQDLGFEVGLRIKPNSHGLLGYGMLSCRDLDQVLRLASCHYHLITELFSMRYRRVAAGHGEAVFSPVTAMPLCVLRFHMESIAVSVHQHLALLAGEAQQGRWRLSLGMSQPRHHARYTALSADGFRFDERALPGITLRIDAAALEQPLPLAAPQVVEQIDEHLESLRPRPLPDASWGDYITMLLRESQGQQVTLEDIARRMNISARTVDRKLRQEQLQFRELSQRVRFERARDLLLAQRGHSVARVAEQLGFTDPANFTRAFRRRAGATPSAFRQLAGMTVGA